MGTRLHGGIRALQHKRRSLIIGVDHRGLEKARDFGLPVAGRYIPAADLERAVRSDRPCEVNLPVNNILRWKRQWTDGGSGMSDNGVERRFVISHPSSLIPGHWSLIRPGITEL